MAGVLPDIYNLATYQLSALFFIRYYRIDDINYKDNRCNIYYG